MKYPTIFEPLNTDDLREFEVVARIHESSPRNWDPNYVVKEAAIEACIARLQKMKENPSSNMVLLAKENEHIVGLHWLRLFEYQGKNAAHIDSLWVADAQRGRGIGRELKSRGETWARSRGAQLMVTEVFYSNKKMIDYNLMLGFVARQVEMVKKL